MFRRKGSKFKKDKDMWEGKLCRNVFFEFSLPDFGAGKLESVTLGNAEVYLKKEFKSVGRKSGWGSSATSMIFCRWLKYICSCLKA